MTNISKKTKHKPHQLNNEKLMERDAMALATLIYDIYQYRKRIEAGNGASPSI